MNSEAIEVIAPVEVPDLGGLPRDDALRAITDAGFSLGIVRYEANDAAVGSVIAQNPRGRERLVPGMSISIIVSTGPKDEASGFGTDDPTVLPPLTPEPAKPTATLEIASYPANLNVGDRGQLTYELLNAAEGIYAEWFSDNPNVAVVDSVGNIAAIAPGDVEITVQAGDLRSSVLVHVND
jgi:hypothetical protein